MKRWAIIRHFRYFYHLWRFNRWWRQARHSYLMPSPLDIEYLDGVWEGAW